MQIKMNEIQKACQILKSGGVVGVPTETVYGLAGSIESESGIDCIFSTKERPFFDPLIVHISSIEQAKKCVTNWPKVCEVLANHFWPGPVTFILPKSDLISDKISSGLDTVGVRMPRHPVTLKLIEELGHPVAAPSANKFKKTSPTTAKHVKEEFPNELVLDGGDCEVGIESTILGIFENKILIYRPGMTTSNQINEVLRKENIEIEVLYQESPVAPGNLKHHYMPKKPIILKVINEEKHSASHIPKNLIEKCCEWELPKNASLAARDLYGVFRSLDKKDSESILIKITTEQIKDENFKGILNRLVKAASYTLPKKLSNKS
jgi:L-threonylcarbamoyladenylate synthase